LWWKINERLGVHKDLAEALVIPSRKKMGSKIVFLFFLGALVSPARGDAVPDETFLITSVNKQNLLKALLQQEASEPNFSPRGNGNKDEDGYHYDRPQDPLCLLSDGPHCQQTKPDNGYLPPCSPGTSTNEASSATADNETTASAADDHEAKTSANYEASSTANNHAPETTANYKATSTTNDHEAETAANYETATSANYYTPASSSNYY
uniref:Uncharacterized protein n=1 Tax=Anopheles atroparvus TaxID=41427 RepID=A0A182JE46_ANOAO